MAKETEALSPTATATAEPVRDARDLDIEKMRPNSQEYRDWRMGRKSAKEPSSEDLSATAASTTATETEDEEEETEVTAVKEAPPATAATAAESQAATTSEKKKARQRYHELVDLIRAKDAEISQLRQPKETHAEKPAPQAGTVANQEITEPGMDDVDPKTGKPAYTTFGEYLKARDTWLEEHILKGSTERIEKAHNERMSQEQARQVTDQFRNRVDKAREKYADYDEIVGAPALHIPANSPMEASCVLSEHGAEMAYMLGQNPAEAERIAKLPAFQQAREMFLLELLAGGWDGLAKDSRFQPRLTSSLKKKTVTAATAIPHEIGGSGQVLPDEVEQAAKDAESDDDPQAVRRFIAASNRRDLARRKGK